MKISIATSWNDHLVKGLAKLNEEFKTTESQIYEIYGSFQTSVVGCARPAPTIPKINETAAKKHIELAHSNGLEFNYLLNSTCLGNREFEKEGHARLIGFLEKLVDMGVDAVTIATPYLIELVRKQFPELKIRSSTLSSIDSGRKANLYEGLGADVIELNPDINRNFERIKEIKKTVDCKLEVLVTRSCIYECPYLWYHFNLASHASQQTEQKYGSFYVDYCMAKCLLIRLTNFQEFIKSPWVRPEDLAVYEDIGINYIKISGRRMTTDWLLNCAKAYLSRKYDGNLLDLVYKHANFAKRFVKHPLSNSCEELDPLEITIDNRSLDGFLDFFTESDYFPCEQGCKSCGYCQQVAKKVVKADSDLVHKYITRLKETIKKLIDSSFIQDKQYKKLKKLWKDRVDTRRIL